MIRICYFSGAIALLFSVIAAIAAEGNPTPAKTLRDRVSPSMYAVQYTWAYEFGRIDFVTCGVVVRDDGLMMIPLSAVGTGLPDSQLVDVKIIVPSKENDEVEIDAIFQGRDERTELAFVKPRESGREWKPITFEEVPIEVGDEVTSIGMLPKDAGYSTYFQRGVIAARLRGEHPAWLVTGGGVGAVGAPVFNADGQAIGVVMGQMPQQPFLHTSNERRNQSIVTLAAVNIPPALFTPTSDFMLSLTDPPTPEKPVALPWIGTPQLTGLEKDVAEAFGLQDQPAIEIGDVIKDSPAERAGLKVGQKIVKLNGKPLERGDNPEELPSIFGRTLRQMPIGTEITLSVLTEKDQPLTEVKVTLEQRPKDQRELRRFWAEDLGFSTRDVSFQDTYSRKQPANMEGVVVALTKREGAAAAARLEMGDIVTTLNGESVKDLDQFEAAYKALRSDKPREPVVVVVLKPDATTQTIKIEPPQ
ncbi:MAG TPA: PDZ domain-containing protein [Tepidisphaeraceae bacterium]|nr:PDZ domain-containing protein [Tepidisphaeraceae bacterium]